MSLIHRLFGASTDATVLCPRCERAIEGHDDAACARKMSRRWFIGATVGAAVAVAVPMPPSKTVCGGRLGPIPAGSVVEFSEEIVYLGSRYGGKTEATRCWVEAAVASGDNVICPQLDGSILTGPQWLAKFPPQASLMGIPYFQRRPEEEFTLLGTAGVKRA